jgi:hypothetical protein
MVMRTRLTSLMLLLIVAGGVFAGTPLHSNEQSCSMGEMDCCKKAAMAQNATPQVTAARLCCSLNCSHDGTTPSNGARTSPKVQPAISDYQFGATIVPPPLMLTRQVHSSHGPPAGSQPAYIRHLALLI